MLDAYLKQTGVYTDKEYTIRQLAEALNKKERAVSQAIKSGGFTGFREYINYLRLEHFKQLASTHSDKNIKELMYLCGFTSRTTFYRIFKHQRTDVPLRLHITHHVLSYLYREVRSIAYPIHRKLIQAFVTLTFPFRLFHNYIPCSTKLYFP